MSGVGVMVCGCVVGWLFVVVVVVAVKFVVFLEWASFERGKKKEKMIKKVPFSPCAQEAQVSHMKKNEEKSLLVSDWE